MNVNTASYYVIMGWFYKNSERLSFYKNVYEKNLFADTSIISHKPWFRMPLATIKDDWISYSIRATCQEIFVTARGVINVVHDDDLNGRLARYVDHFHKCNVVNVLDCTHVNGHVFLPLPYLPEGKQCFIDRCNLVEMVERVLPPPPTPPPPPISPYFLRPRPIHPPSALLPPLNSPPRFLRPCLPPPISPSIPTPPTLPTPSIPSIPIPISPRFLRPRSPPPIGLPHHSIPTSTTCFPTTRRSRPLKKRKKNRPKTNRFCYNVLNTPDSAQNPDTDDREPGTSSPTDREPGTSSPTDSVTSIEAYEILRQSSKFDFLPHVLMSLALPHTTTSSDSVPRSSHSSPPPSVQLPLISTSSTTVNPRRIATRRRPVSFFF